jgi:hypothetical protein
MKVNKTFIKQTVKGFKTYADQGDESILLAVTKEDGLRILPVDSNIRPQFVVLTASQAAELTLDF